MGVAGEPDRKRRCGHPRRMGDRAEAGCCGIRRYNFAGPHRMARGADIEREPSSLSSIAKSLCLDRRNHANDAEDDRHNQRSHSNLLDEVNDTVADAFLPIDAFDLGSAGGLTGKSVSVASASAKEHMQENSPFTQALDDVTPDVLLCRREQPG